MAPRPCRVCWREFTPTRSNNIYCSVRCKNTAYYRRRAHAAIVDGDPWAPGRDPVAAAQPAAVRNCPHCGEPITIVALLTTPEAARPSISHAAPDVVLPIQCPTHAG